MDELVAAADVSGLSTNVATILVTMISIGLLFVAYKNIKKAMNK
jgi:hypothetical protein